MHNETEIFRELAPLLQVRPELQQICRFARNGDPSISRSPTNGRRFTS